MNIKLKAMLYTAGVIGVFLGVGFLISVYPYTGMGLILAVSIIALTRAIYLIVLDILGG